MLAAAAIDMNVSSPYVEKKKNDFPALSGLPWVERMTWTKACRVQDIPVGTIVRHRLSNGSPVALTRLADDRVIAFENRCPHVGGPLALGQVRGNEIVCPWHFFRFDLVTGEAVGADKSIMRMKFFPVTIENGDVFVQADRDDFENVQPTSQASA
jgi:nitrite reductase (NADH) small subunit